MIITYRRITHISYPVFQIPSSNWELLDGLLFLDGEVLDDRNMPGDTLGKRRLQSPFRKELVELKKSFHEPVAIIKQSSPYFIDNKGIPFIYEKTKFCSLRFHKIKRVEPKVVASLLYLEGVKQPFKIPRPPPKEMLWAGVLYLHELPWMLYTYSPIKKRNGRRKV